MHRTRFAVVLAVAVVLGGTVSSSADPENGEIRIVKLLGTATGEVRSFSDFGDIPPTDQGTTEALCFEVNLTDVQQDDRVIGTAFDCLADFTLDADGNGLSLTDTVIFQFPDGTLVSRARVTIQGISDGSPDFTHITGAIPPQDAVNTLLGTGGFTNKQGRVRLSGAVNLSRFGEDPPVIDFDCLLVIRLEPVEE